MLTEELTTTMMAIRQKLVFIGNYSVGKTSIIKRILDDSFKDNYESTIGIDYYTKNIGYKETIFKCQIWDTAGQERYKSLIPAYLRGASLIFIVYDINKESSLNDVENWINFVKNNCNNPKMILIGNKSDLERKITYENGCDFAKKNNLIFFETSAKTNHNISNMFYSSISQLSFFNDIRKENNDLVEELINENEGDKSKIVITKNGEIKEIKEENNIQQEPKLNIVDIKKKSTIPINKKNKCSC